MRRCGSTELNRMASCFAAPLAVFLTVALRCTAGDDVARADELFRLSKVAVTDSSGSSGFRTLPPAIQPMTTVSADGSGYFSDPSPVRLAPSRGGRTQVFSGTTKAIMSCAYPVTGRCFSWTRVAVNSGALRATIAAAGATVTNFQNLAAFQDDAGGWHAVLAIGVRSPAHPDHWTVLVHAQPAAVGVPGTVPPAWSADSVLAGSFATPADGNYDGKHFQDGERLYLLYVKNFVSKPGLRNGIVIQPMLSPTQAAPEGATTLLLPGDRDGALDSEWYDHTKAKLVEAPYIVKIAEKYALLYSTGAYQQDDYKAGVAWSDTLRPAAGRFYRKVLEIDSRGIWGHPGRAEVRYLLQSQRPRWPNFTGGQVISPGVASAVRGPGGAWWLYFAGFDPADRPLTSPGVAEADHRRPYFVRLRASVPVAQTVAAATDAELAAWLQPEAQ